MIDRNRLPNLLNSIDADELRRRLDQLDGERAALLTLLRAARARERANKYAGNHKSRKGGTSDAS
jgi:hypothetical protein